MQVISSIIVSFFFHLCTASLTSSSQALLGLLVKKNGIATFIASSFEMNSQSPSDPRMTNLSSSEISSCLVISISRVNFVQNIPGSLLTPHE